MFEKFLTQVRAIIMDIKMGEWVPTLDGGKGVPTLDGGGDRVPTLDGGRVPTLDGGGGTYLGWGEGVPTLYRLCRGRYASCIHAGGLSC